MKREVPSVDRVHYECTVTETNGWDLALVIQNSVKRKKKPTSLDF